MMSTQCQYIRDQLSAYQEGELDARRQAMVREHLAACPACRRELALLQQTLGALPAWEMPAVDPGLSSALLERLATREARVSWWRPLVCGWGRVALPAGAAALLVVALMIFGRPAPHHDVVRTNRPTTHPEVRITERRFDAKAKGDAVSKVPAGNDMTIDRVEVGNRVQTNGKGDVPSATPTPDPATVAVALMEETPLPPAAETLVVTKSPDEVAIDSLMETQ